MTRQRFFWLALIAFIALFVGGNALAGVIFKGWRLDLTENGLYTLSKGTKTTIRTITEPIDVTFFYSRAMAQNYPAIRAYGARVREMLQGYAARSGGRLRLEIIDPEPFSEAEDRAIAAGLEGAPTANGEQLYFGLSARNAVDERVTVPFFNPEREPFLEYELTRALAELERPAEPKVAVITSLPFQGAPAMFGGGGAPGLYVYSELSRAFDLDFLENDFTEVPADASMLLIAHPWPLTPPQLYAIDQFMLAKGRAVILLDPASRLGLAPGPGGLPPQESQRASDLGALLAAWGVSYDKDWAVVDPVLALRASVIESGRRVQRNYPAWLGVSPDQLSDEDLATAPLTRGLNLASPGALAPAPGAKTRFTALATSSPLSDLVPAEDTLGDAQIRDLIAHAKGEPKARVLAARVAGPIATAFPEGPPVDAVAPKEPKDKGEIAAIIVADSDLLDDGFYVGQDALLGPTTVMDNAAFVLNALDLLGGSDALVSLRSRARSDRPMVRVDRLRARAESRFLDEQKRLEAELDAAQARLAELQKEGKGSGFFAGDVEAEINAAEAAEVEAVRAAIGDTRARLRAVQRSFRADIDQLEAVLIFLNVWLVPLVVAGIGVAVFVARRRDQGLAGGGGS